jgi:hypothetical protein
MRFPSICEAIAGPLIATRTGFRKKDIKKIAYLMDEAGKAFLQVPATLWEAAR